MYPCGSSKPCSKTRLWLARTMAAAGRPLLAGDVLLSGALGPMTPVVAGDRLQLRLTRLGEVACRFV